MKEIKRRWFSMKADGKAAEVAIFDEIGGWGVRVQDFKKEFDAVKGSKSITLYLNSPGGDVFDGMALYNILSAEREKITVKVLGLAASAASVIALSGKRLIMGEGSFFMLHNPWTLAMGDATELRKTAELLDQIGQNMASIYESRSGYSYEEIVDLMAEETWLDAGQAVEAGFAESVEEGEAVAALSCDVSKFKFRHAPKAMVERIEKRSNTPATARDFEAFLRDAGGFSRSNARTITAKGFTAISGGMPEEDGAGNAPKGEDAAEPKVIEFPKDRLRALQAKYRLLAAS